MRPRVIALTAALATVAGCGSASDALGPGNGVMRPRPAAHVGATAAGNRSATIAEAKRLLGLAPVPDAAVRIDRPKGEGSAPALGIPSTSSLVDRSRFYRVDEPFEQVYAYAKAHRPKGLKAAGSSSTATRGVMTGEGIAWSEPDTSYAVELGASVSVRPADHRTKTLLRVDGYGEWLDPRPIRDQSDGPRFHVDLASGCPENKDPTADVRNLGSDLNRRLLPHAKPIAALICEYDGANRRPHFGLGRQARLGPAAAGKLAGRLQRLSIAHTNGGVYHCPADDGTANLLVFRYPGRPDVDLLAKANGCQDVVNGDILVNGGVSYRPWVRPLPI